MARSNRGLYRSPIERSKVKKAGELRNMVFVVTVITLRLEHLYIPLKYFRHSISLR